MTKKPYNEKILMDLVWYTVDKGEERKWLEDEIYTVIHGNTPERIGCHKRIDSMIEKMYEAPAVDMDVSADQITKLIDKMLSMKIIFKDSEGRIRWNR